MAPREAYEKPVFSIKQRKKTHANRWRRKKRAVWRANHDLDPKPSIRKNLTSETTSSVEAAVSAGRDEASCLLLRCRSFATPRVFLAWNYICDSPMADIRFSLGSTGAGGSSVFIRMHFEPGRPQRANACGLFDSGFVCAPAT